MKQKRICDSRNLLELKFKDKCSDWDRSLHITIGADSTSDSTRGGVLLVAQQADSGLFGRTFLNTGNLVNLLRPGQFCYDPSCDNQFNNGYFRPAERNRGVAMRFGDFQIFVLDDFDRERIRVEVIPKWFSDRSRNFKTNTK